MKIFEIANTRNSRGNGCPVIRHVITRVNSEKEKRGIRAVLHTGEINPGQDLDLVTTTRVWEL